MKTNLTLGSRERPGGSLATTKGDNFFWFIMLNFLKISADQKKKYWEIVAPNPRITENENF